MHVSLLQFILMEDVDSDFEEAFPVKRDTAKAGAKLAKAMEVPPLSSINHPQHVTFLHPAT